MRLPDASMAFVTLYFREQVAPLVKCLNLSIALWSAYPLVVLHDNATLVDGIYPYHAHVDELSARVRRPRGHVRVLPRDHARAHPRVLPRDHERAHPRVRPGAHSRGDVREPSHGRHDSGRRLFEWKHYPKIYRHKFLAWTLDEFDRIVIIDADTYLRHRVDILFTRPLLAQIAGVPACENSTFNGGVLVATPSRVEARALLSLAASKSSQKRKPLCERHVTDQTLLNVRFARRWQLLPWAYNYAKHHFMFGYEHKLPKAALILHAIGEPKVPFCERYGHSIRVTTKTQANVLARLTQSFPGHHKLKNKSANARARAGSRPSSFATALFERRNASTPRKFTKTKSGYI